MPDGLIRDVRRNKRVDNVRCYPTNPSETKAKKPNVERYAPFMKMAFLFLALTCWIAGTFAIGLGMLIAGAAIIESEFETSSAGSPALQRPNDSQERIHSR